MLQNQELMDLNVVNNDPNNNSNLYSETPQSQSGNVSLTSNSNPNINYKTNSLKDSTTSSTFAQPYSKKLKRKRKSTNSNESLKKSKSANNLNNNNDNKQENVEPELEPIMEAPPLVNIVKRDDIYEFYINNPDRNTQELMFKDNTVSTTKYNALTFLPKALLYQFIRLANIYFVFIAIITSIPIISPLGPATAIAPLVFVLAVSLIREAVEDLKRRKLDNEQNSNEVEIYKNGEWIKIQSGKLRMGEIVKVKKDGVFPSDLMLIDSNLQDGICFIETGTLDGEKTLKIKSSPNFTKGKFSKINDNNQINKEKNNIMKHEEKNYKLQKKNSEIMVLNRQKSIESRSSGRSNASLIQTKKIKVKKKKLIDPSRNSYSHTEINSLQDTKNRKLFGLRLLKNTLFVLVPYTYGNLPRTLLDRLLGLLLDGNNYIALLVKICLNCLLVCIGGKCGTGLLRVAVEVILVSAGGVLIGNLNCAVVLPRKLNLHRILSSFVTAEARYHLIAVALVLKAEAVKSSHEIVKRSDVLIDIIQIKRLSKKGLSEVHSILERRKIELKLGSGNSVLDTFKPISFCHNSLYFNVLCFYYSSLSDFLTGESLLVILPLVKS